MAAEQVLIPHNILIKFGLQEVRIESGDLSILLDNNCSFTRYNSTKGMDIFPLAKEGYIRQLGNISVIIPKTNDEKQKSSIEYLIKMSDENQKRKLQEVGTSTFVALIKDSAGKQILSISFEGYLAKIKQTNLETGNDFGRYIASFVVADVASVLFS